MRLKLLLLLLYVKTSLADDIQGSTTTGKEGRKKNAKKQPEPLALASTPRVVGDNYNFGYEIGDGDNSHKFHKEVGDGNGRKIGSYGFTDADGRQRVVQYVADENGFRVQIKTNEPGTNTHEAAASLVQKRPTIVLLDDKDSPMALPVKTPTRTREPSSKRKDSLYTAPSFYSPVLPNGPVRMYETQKSVYFAGPAAQSIEYKPHPKAIQIGPLLNVIGTPIAMPMQSPILPLGPVKVSRYDPAGPLGAPSKYQSPIPIPIDNHVGRTAAAFVEQPALTPPTFEPLRISSTEKHAQNHPPAFRKDLQTSFPKFDPSKFNILSMYQTTLLPNGPKMYDGPVHAYVRAPPKGPPPNRLIYDDPPRKPSPRRKVVRKKKVNLNSDGGLQTTENGLELSQTIHDQSTVFYVPAEHAPPVRRRLAKPIFKKKRQPLQHGDGTPAQELHSPLTGSKPVVYDDPVGDLKPVPLFKGSSVTGFLPPSGKLAGPSEAYKLVPIASASPPVANHLSQPAGHPPVTVQAPHPVQVPPHLPPPTPAVIHRPTPQLSPTIPQGGLVAQSYQAPAPHSHPEPLYQARLEQPVPPQFQPVPQAAPGPESLKIPSYPKLTEIERAAALKLAEQPLHIQPTLKEVPLQAIEHQRRPQLQIGPQQHQGFPQHHGAPPDAIQEVPAPNLGLHRQPEPIQFPQPGSPSLAQQTPLHEYFAKQAPTFLQNQEAIVSKFTTAGLTVPAPHFEQYKTTEASFKQAEAKPAFPQNLRPYIGPPQIPHQLPGGHQTFIPPRQAPPLHSQQPPHGIHHRPHLSYHQGAEPVGSQGPLLQGQPQSPHASLPPEAFNHHPPPPPPPPAVSAPPPPPQHFTLPNQGPVLQAPPTFQNPPPPNIQQRAPSIIPPQQPRHILVAPEQYTNSPQIAQSPFPVGQVPPTQHVPPHPSQHLPPQVLPPHYQQPPGVTFQQQQQVQQHPPPQLLQVPPQHLPAPQQIARSQHLAGGHPQTLQGPPSQHLSHVPPQHLHQPGGAPSPQHLLPPNLLQSTQPPNIGPPQHLLTHGQPPQHQILAQPPPQHIQTHPPQFQSIPPPPQLLHSLPPQPGVVPGQLGSHSGPPTQLQHRPLQILQSQPPPPPLPQLQSQPTQFRNPPPHYPSQQSHLSLQPQASSQEKTTHSIGPSLGGLQAQAFISEQRRPKSLADHSPFEYIKKSSR